MYRLITAFGSNLLMLSKVLNISLLYVFPLCVTTKRLKLCQSLIFVIFKVILFFFIHIVLIINLFNISKSMQTANRDKTNYEYV